MQFSQHEILLFLFSTVRDSLFGGRLTVPLSRAVCTLRHTQRLSYASSYCSASRRKQNTCDPVVPAGGARTLCSSLYPIWFNNVIAQFCCRRAHASCWSQSLSHLSKPYSSWFKMTHIRVCDCCRWIYLARLFSTNFNGFWINLTRYTLNARNLSTVCAYINTTVCTAHWYSHLRI